MPEKGGFSLFAFFRHGIVAAMLIKWVTSQNTPQRKEKPYYYAAFFNSFDSISRTGRMKTAVTGL